MKKSMFFLSLLLPFSVVAQLQYPTTRKAEVIDEYNGTRVVDPYRWLEDDNSDETKQWVKQQNEVTFNYLATIPQRPAVKKRLEELWNYERYSSPFKKGNYYYFF